MYNDANFSKYLKTNKTFFRTEKLTTECVIVTKVMRKKCIKPSYFHVDFITIQTNQQKPN